MIDTGPIVTATFDVTYRDDGFDGPQFRFARCSHVLGLEKSADVIAVHKRDVMRLHGKPDVPAVELVKTEAGHDLVCATLARMNGRFLVSTVDRRLAAILALYDALLAPMFGGWRPELKEIRFRDHLANSLYLKSRSTMAGIEELLLECDRLCATFDPQNAPSLLIGEDGYQKMGAVELACLMPQVRDFHAGRPPDIRFAGADGQRKTLHDTSLAIHLLAWRSSRRQLVSRCGEAEATTPPFTSDDDREPIPELSARGICVEPKSAPQPDIALARLVAAAAISSTPHHEGHLERSAPGESDILHRLVEDHRVGEADRPLWWRQQHIGHLDEVNDQLLVSMSFASMRERPLLSELTRIMEDLSHKVWRGRAEMLRRDQPMTAIPGSRRKWEPPRNTP